MTPFEFVCKTLEEATYLDRAAARGTVRLALKEGGLDPDSVTAAQMGVVIEQIVPGELKALGIDNVERVCQDARAGLSALEATAPDTSATGPEALFARLGND